MLLAHRGLQSTLKSIWETTGAAPRLVSSRQCVSLSLPIPLGPRRHCCLLVCALVHACAHVRMPPESGAVADSLDRPSMVLVGRRASGPAPEPFMCTSAASPVLLLLPPLCASPCFQPLHPRPSSVHNESAPVSPFLSGGLANHRGCSYGPLRGRISSCVCVCVCVCVCARMQVLYLRALGNKNVCERKEGESGGLGELSLLP